MAAQLKLHEREKNVLKLEEESLRSLIFQYQSALNALKVEELTLTNKLGQSLDRARRSYASTPTISHLNVNTPEGLPTLVSKINTTEKIFKPSPLSASESQISEDVPNHNKATLTRSKNNFNSESYGQTEDEIEVWNP